jgi:predicted nuclease of predicted toxin-antitoxin system
LKLLFDENLSFRLAMALADLFPGSTHVEDVGLEESSDDVIWRYADDHGYAIVTKDADFADRSLVERAPPKVVWIRRGNCSTRQIESLLRERHDDLEEFEANNESLLRVL